MTLASIRRAAGKVLPPLVLGVLFVFAWQTWINVSNVKPYVVPRPTKIWSAFIDAELASACRDGET